jgi:2-methylisocitrate lyase-like PEP mutase family enzyme
VVGTVNAYSALLAERAGFKALYLSGAGVANASFGLPDLGMTSLNDVCEDVRRITGATRRCRCWWTPTPAGARPSTSPARCAT